MPDADGFETVECCKCNRKKLAGLFSPSSLRRTHPICIKCTQAYQAGTMRYAKAPPSKENWRGGPTMMVTRRWGRVVPLFGAETPPSSTESRSVVPPGKEAPDVGGDGLRNIKT